MDACGLMLSEFPGIGVRFGEADRKGGRRGVNEKAQDGGDRPGPCPDREPGRPEPWTPQRYPLPQRWASPHVAVRSSRDLGGGRFMIERACLDPGHELHPRQRRHDEVSTLLAWCDLQGLALWREHGDLERGELKASLADLARRWGWDTSKVRRFLEKLETMNEIEWDRGGGADTSHIRIVRYEEIQLRPSTRKDREGTDTPSDTPERHPKSPTTSRDSRGNRHPPARNGRRPHIYTEEEENIGRTREGKKDERAPVETRLHAAWKTIQEAAEHGRSEALDLDPVAEEALQRAGGTEALESARHRPHGVTEVKNAFRQAYHELSGSKRHDEAGPEELVL